MLPPRRAFMSLGETMKNKGLKKRCECARRTWETCAHPWFFTFQWKGRVERGSLGESEREKAVTKLTEIKAGVMNGTYVRVRQATTPQAVSTRATFRMVADEYAKDVEGLAKLAAASQRQHGYAVTFLAGVAVPPGLPFTDKPFTDIIRADIKAAIHAKETPSEKTYSKGERTWTRTVGGKVAANRLHDHLRSLWNWAIEQGYATASPFLRTRKGKNRLKHVEFSRDRRLRDGEEAALLAQANPLLKDVIVAALETGMRKGELLSLVWRQVRWLQNDLYLPGGKTKARRDRKIPISPNLREILTRRQHGMTEGPNPQQFKYGPEHYVFGNEAGAQIKDVKTAWENTVLKAHGVKPERARGGRLSAECRAKLAEIDLHEHDLRHEAGSRKLEAGWPLHAVSAFLGHANITTTARYLNVKDDYLQELTERTPLTLVRA
jgi:integrase